MFQKCSINLTSYVYLVEKPIQLASYPESKNYVFSNQNLVKRRQSRKTSSLKQSGIWKIIKGIIVFK